MADLIEEGFIMTSHEPVNFETIVNILGEKEFDAILIDFRLSSGKALFDGPAIAQTVRTMSSIKENKKKHIPIFLITAESNISDYYDDVTSNDLFDLSVSKEVFQQQIKKYSKRFKSIINGYRKIEELNFDLNLILDNSKKMFNIDYRITEKLNNEHSKANTYFVSKFIYNQIVRAIGVLIGEEVLSARLGINMNSKGWNTIKNVFSNAKYTGIFSDSYERWWAIGIEEICLQRFNISSLRRLNAEQRISIFNKSGFEDLEPLEKLDFSESTNFWTICQEKKLPIDPIDGLELSKRETFPWQEKEYISILAAYETSPLYKYVKEFDKIRFKELLKAKQ